jgi:hypothetical protein
LPIRLAGIAKLVSTIPAYKTGSYFVTTQPRVGRSEKERNEIGKQGTIPAYAVSFSLS